MSLSPTHLKLASPRATSPLQSNFSVLVPLGVPRALGLPPSGRSPERRMSSVSPSGGGNGSASSKRRNGRHNATGCTESPSVTSSLPEHTLKQPPLPLLTSSNHHSTVNGGGGAATGRNLTLLERRARERNGMSVSGFSMLSMDTIRDAETNISDQAPQPVFRGWSNMTTAEHHVSAMRRCSGSPYTSTPAYAEPNSVGAFGSPIKLVSYNILADRLVSTDRYPKCHPVVLGQQYRLALIQEELRQVAADVVVLTEISVEVFEGAGMLGGFLRNSLGYGGDHAVVTDQHGVPRCTPAPDQSHRHVSVSMGSPFLSNVAHSLSDGISGIRSSPRLLSPPLPRRRLNPMPHKSPQPTGKDISADTCMDDGCAGSPIKARCRTRTSPRPELETTQRRVEMDGVAIFYSRSRFTLLETVKIHFNKIASQDTRLTPQERKRLQVKTHNVALLSVLQDLRDPARVYIIAGVHLIWQYEEAQLWQSHELTTAIELLKAKYTCSSVPHTPSVTVSSSSTQLMSACTSPGTMAATHELLRLCSPDTARRLGAGGGRPSGVGVCVNACCDLRGTLPPVSNTGSHRCAAASGGGGAGQRYVSCLIAGDFNIERDSAPFFYLRHGYVPSWARGLMEHWLPAKKLTTADTVQSSHHANGSSQQQSDHPTPEKPVSSPTTNSSGFDLLNLSTPHVQNAPDEEVRGLMAHLLSPKLEAGACDSSAIHTPATPLSEQRPSAGTAFRARRGDAGGVAAADSPGLGLGIDDHPACNLQFSSIGADLMCPPTPAAGRKKKRQQPLPESSPQQPSGDHVKATPAPLHTPHPQQQPPTVGHDANAEKASSKQSPPGYCRKPIFVGRDSTPTTMVVPSSTRKSLTTATPPLFWTEPEEVDGKDHNVNTEDNASEMDSMLSSANGTDRFDAPGRTLLNTVKFGTCTGSVSSYDNSTCSSSDSSAPHSQAKARTAASCSITTDSDELVLRLLSPHARSSPPSPRDLKVYAQNQVTDTFPPPMKQCACLHFSTSASSTWQDIGLVSKVRHGLRLSDAYKKYCKTHASRVSAVNPSSNMEGKVLDHILFDSGNLSCISVLRLGEVATLPNQSAPSDHYMIGAILVPFAPSSSTTAATPSGGVARAW